MAEISAKDVAALRKATGAGMMDCKKALERANGDMERRQGLAAREGHRQGAASSRAARPTEGAVEVLVDGNVGAIVELNCNTDFVAKGDVFTAGRRALAKLVVERGRRRRRVAAVRRRDRRRDAHAARRASSARSSSSAAWSASRRPTASSTRYKHIQNDRGTIGVLVELGGVDAVRRRRPARSRTTSRCTSRSPRPAIVTRDDVPADDVERERAVIEAKSRNEGKPEDKLPAQDRRGSSTVLQGRRRCSSRVREGPEADDRQARRRPRRRSHAPALRPRQDRRGRSVPTTP